MTLTASGLSGFPTVSLLPGSTDSTDVVVLQNWLVKNGLLTQAQMNSGPGIYGPATTAAVTSLQQQLGVNAGSAAGDYGPKTIATIQAEIDALNNVTPNPDQIGILLIEQFEGFISNAKFDQNAYRVGFGNDLYAIPNGSGGWIYDLTVQSNTTTTFDAAVAELQHRLDTNSNGGIPGIERDIGTSKFLSLSPLRQAVLESLAWNYGSFQSSALATVLADLKNSASNAQIANDIQALTANASRRAAEADLFRWDPPGGTPGDTQAPTLSVDSTLSIHTGDTLAITSSLLVAVDNVSSGAALHYAVTTSPAHGTLMLGGSATTSFTQADINNGLVTYHETTGGVSSDSFFFTVTDAAGNTSNPASFQIGISAPADTQAPNFVNDNPLSIHAGDTQAITSSLLSATDNVSSGAQLHYTVTTAPVNGTLLVNGSANSTFTQADIDSGLVSYHETVAGATSDVFFFKITDAAGNATSSQPFQINIGTAVSQAATNDFNGDHKSDILWHSDAGSIATWDMNDGTLLSGNSLGSVPVSWKIAGTGDFNGDGKTDILWRSDSGSIATWDMNDGTILSAHSLGSVPANWTIAGTGDFNGDHKADILWRSDTGAIATWDMNDGTLLSGNSLGSVPTSWKIAGTGDFNGDGKTDILWRSDSGSIATWDMNDGTILSAHSLGSVPANWTIAGTGDFNGDHKADILWRSDTGAIATWDMNDGTLLSGNSLGSVPASWKIAGTGDFNGDGKTDILWRSDSGSIATWDMNDATLLSAHSLGTVPDGWHIIA